MRRAETLPEVAPTASGLSIRLTRDVSWRLHICMVEHKYIDMSFETHHKTISESLDVGLSPLPVTVANEGL